MNLVIWFLAGAMTGVTFSRFAALAENVFDLYSPPAVYFSILIGAMAAVGMGSAVNWGYTNYNVFTFEPGDFDFPALLAAEVSALIALAVLFTLA